MAEEKKAKKVYTLDDIKYNEENRVLAIVSWIWIVGLVLLLTEKKDDFVRYNGAQAVLLGLTPIVCVIPVIGWFLAIFIGPVVLVCTIIGMVKSSNGERFDIPGISELALKAMSAI